MESKRISDHFTISGQLSPDDLAELQAAGVKTLIGNRPDNEVPGQPPHADIEKRAKELGIAVHYLPVVHDTINSNDVNAFAAILDSAEQPVHAWCRSGLRSIALWSLAQIKAGADSKVLVDKATQLGFDFRSFQRRFAPVIAEVTGAFDKLPLGQHCPILIVGGGAAGISIAASLLRRDPELQITIIEPSETHYYQPGFTLVGCGEFTVPQLRRKTADLMPEEVQWIRASVTNFLPAQSQVVLSDGTRLGYDRLCVCAGLKLNWAAIEGLPETLGKNGVTSNYSPETAPYTWQLVQELKGGRAVFTQPPMPIKCAGAPQKVLYLSSDHWQRQGLLDKIDVDFYNAGAVLFGVKDYVPALESYIRKYQIDLHLGHNLVKVDGPRKLATFASTDASGQVQLHEVSFDMLHVTPPQCAPDFIGNSPLADRAGWVDVDQATLRHKKYRNIWGLGDVTNAPNAKTAAAVRKQVPVVANNLMADIQQQADNSIYDGYGSCPLTVARGRIVLAEFGYGGKLLPTFPAWLNDGTKATWLAWALKRYLLPPIYWHMMLRGWETLAAPQPKPEEQKAP
jgi:sulfide:quinone oxidoreductase